MQKKGILVLSRCQKIAINPVDKLAKQNESIMFDCFIEGYNSNEHLVEKLNHTLQKKQLKVLKLKIDNI